VRIEGGVRSLELSIQKVFSITRKFLSEIMHNPCQIFLLTFLVRNGNCDWEVDVLASFFSLLYSTRVNCDGKDQLWLFPSHKGKFDVRSFYKALACKEAIHFPWKSIWRTKVPLKVAFFAWTAAQGKILTLDNLRKKRVIVIDRCCMCKMNGESVDTFFSIARLNVLYGTPSLVVLVCLGLCLFGW
jgi:hypothetical protein